MNISLLSRSQTQSNNPIQHCECKDGLNGKDGKDGKNCECNTTLKIIENESITINVGDKNMVILIGSPNSGGDGYRMLRLAN